MNALQPLVELPTPGADIDDGKGQAVGGRLIYPALCWRVLGNGRIAFTAGLPHETHVGNALKMHTLTEPGFRISGKVVTGRRYRLSQSTILRFFKVEA